MRLKGLDGVELEYFSRGKRSKIYTFVKREKRFAVKVESLGSAAVGRIKNEVKFLRLLNKHKVGPKLVKSGEGFFVYGFVEGLPILEFIEKSEDPLPVLVKVLKQCRVLDKLGINKLEMHHPMWHIFVDKDKPTLIDFERCYFTEKPKNVTQFGQFLIRCKKLDLNKKRFILLLQEYKERQTEKAFRNVIRCLGEAGSETPCDF